MAYVILPSRRRRPDVFALDHSHPLAQGLVFAGMGSGSPSDKETKNQMQMLDSSRDGRRWNTFSAQKPKWLFDTRLNRWMSDYNGPSSTMAFDVNRNLIENQNAITLSAFCSMNNHGSVNPLWIRNAANIRIGTTSVSGRINGLTTNADLAHSVETAFGQMRHLAYTYDGAIEKLYLDGSLIQTRANSGLISNASVEAWMGGTAGYMSWSSGINGDFAVYSRVLPEQEIKVLANPTDPMLEGLIRDKKPAPKHWHLGALPKVYPINIVGSQIGETIKWNWGE